METVHSINRAPIRLTAERWQHIVSNKPYMEAHYEDMLDAIENPTWILRGYAGSLVAVVPLARQRFLHTVYKETGRDDGFVITAFVARDYNRRMIVWP